MVDHFSRYQPALSLCDMYPDPMDGRCACGCGVELIGRNRKWASAKCRIDSVGIFFIVRGKTATIRNELFKRDSGFCRHCGVLSDDWEADHIIPVHKGGGGVGLENFQTLCYDCHKKKTYSDRSIGHLCEISSQAAVTSDMICV